MGVSLTFLNTATEATFIAHLGGVFEHSPWVAERSFAARPFASLNALHGAMVEVVAKASAKEQLELIRAHPDLAGKVALADLTESSRREQAGAGLDRVREAELKRFHRLNEAYKAKFEFPFILAVKGHTVNSILLSFEDRLENSLAAEKERALHEIAKIARFRLEALLGA